MTFTDTSHVKAVLFDVYGTLIEFRTAKYHSPYGNLLAALPLQRQQREQAIHLFLTRDLPAGEDVAAILRQLAPGLVIPPDVLRNLATELDEHMACASLYADSKEVLVALRRRNYRLALVSNLATPYRLPIRRLGLTEMVDELVYSYEIGWRKPQPEIFRHALKKLGVLPSEAIFVGDTMVDDIEGATGVGMRAFLIDRSIPATATSLASLTELLCRLAPQ